MERRSKFKLLLDTCVWLDLAKHHRQQSLLRVLEELVSLNEISITVPRTVLDEFGRNKARIISESGRSLSSVLKHAKQLVDEFGDEGIKGITLDQLDDVDHKIPLLGEAAVESVSRIEKLFTGAEIVETSDSIKLRAAQRAIDGKAPFHRQRNGMNDAIIIETYSDLINSKNRANIRFSFITHNKKDFSHPTANDKLPHPDIASYFSKTTSLYFINLAEALQKVEPTLVSDLMVEQEWIEEPSTTAAVIL